MEQLLSEFYSNTNPLTVLDMPFNIRDNDAAAKWNMDVTHLVVCLSQYAHKHVIVFITTHSVPENGDLWLGKDEDGADCATTVGNVSTSLFYHFIQLGFRTGTGLPAVFRLQVPWLWVWFLILPPAGKLYP